MADLILGSTTAISESGGTVTLDNAVQDNITRLGTVTTGTMNNTIGSSATFPAGHVIQVHTYTEELSGSLQMNSDSFNATYSKSTSITPLSSSSKLLVSISSTVYLGSGSNNNNTIGWVALFEGTVSTIRVANRIGWMADTSGRDNFRTCHLQYVADSGTADVAQTFGMCVRNWSSSYNNNIGWSNEGGVNEFSIVIMEYN